MIFLSIILLTLILAILDKPLLCGGLFLVALTLAVREFLHE